MEKVYTEEEVRKLIKMSHIIASESDFKETERSEIIKRDRYLYRIGEEIADIVIDYDKYYLSWNVEYLVWYKTTFNNFPHNNFFSSNHLNEILEIRKDLKSLDEFKVITFDEYKIHQLKMQSILREMEKQHFKGE